VTGGWFRLIAVLMFLAAGCATQEWTEDLLFKRKVEVDDRFITVEAGAREQAQRIDRVEVRVAHLETQVTETRDLALGRRAPRPASPWSPRATRTLVAVVHVPFGFDRADLDLAAKAALTSVARELRDNPKMTVDLEGTTDPAGRVDYNVRLSQRRVESVKRWLVTRGLEPSRVVQSAGLGPLPDPSVKDEGKRRVTVKLMSSAE
jgi:outer membrane protein OmpA-like peptidoglycan-associated protein